MCAVCRAVLLCYALYYVLRAVLLRCAAALCCCAVLCAPGSDLPEMLCCALYYVLCAVLLRWCVCPRPSPHPKA